MISHGTYRYIAPSGFSIYLSKDTGCFQFLAIVSNAALHRGVLISFETLLSILRGLDPEVGLLGLLVVLVFIFILFHFIYFFFEEGVVLLCLP